MRNPKWLASRVRGREMVIAVTHGVFRRLIARRLVAQGWIAEPGRRGYATWSAWGFRLGLSAACLLRVTAGVGRDAGSPQDES